MRAVLAMATLLATGPAVDVRFADDFEGTLQKWSLVGSDYVRTDDSGDPRHGHVLALETGGDVLALIPGSERWGAVSLEGEVQFPTDEDNYLGVVYNHQTRGARRDFGLVYIKGNDSYLQANPHRDFNVSRTLYPEYRVPLRGDAAVRAGVWQQFKVEVADGECHFYVGDMTIPQMTFPHFELTRGELGLQPRSVGGRVWVDNIRVTSIPRLSYTGAPRPGPFTPAAELLTSWEVIGPLERTDDAVAQGARPEKAAWRPFGADARGAVVTGRVVDYHGPRSVAYFRTTYTSPRAQAAVLQLSTVDDLALWVNGRFHWFIPRGPFAWLDFSTNPAHEGQRIPVELKEGSNELVLRVRGGVYASGGFFARIDPE